MQHAGADRRAAAAAQRDQRAGGAVDLTAPGLARAPSWGTRAEQRRRQQPSSSAAALRGADAIRLDLSPQTNKQHHAAQPNVAGTARNDAIDLAGDSPMRMNQHSSEAAQPTHQRSLTSSGSLQHAPPHKAARQDAAAAAVAGAPDPQQGLSLFNSSTSDYALEHECGGPERRSASPGPFAQHSGSLDSFMASPEQQALAAAVAAPSAARAQLRQDAQAHERAAPHARAAAMHAPFQPSSPQDENLRLALLLSAEEAGAGNSTASSAAAAGEVDMHALARADQDGPAAFPSRIPSGRHGRHHATHAGAAAAAAGPRADGMNAHAAAQADQGAAGGDEAMPDTAGDEELARRLQQEWEAEALGESGFGMGHEARRQAAFGARTSRAEARGRLDAAFDPMFDLEGELSRHGIEFPGAARPFSPERRRAGRFGLSQVCAHLCCAQ